MPYTFKGDKDCEKSDGTKGKFYTKKKGKSGRCYDSEDAYKKSMQAGYAGNAADDHDEGTIMEYRKLIRRIVYEHACACEEMGIERPIPGVEYPIEIDEIIVEPVMDMISASAAEEQPAVEVEIDIMPDAVDPMLDTLQDVLLGDDSNAFPYDGSESIIFQPEEKPKSKKKGSEYGRMTRGKLYRMSQMSQSLHDRLEDGQDIPEWAKDKISTAEDRLRSAYSYIDYKLHRMNQEGTMCNESTVRKLIRNYLRR